MELTNEIIQALGAPFSEEELDFLPKANSGGKSLALVYVDARTVMRRLDEVVPGHWHFDFDLLDGGGQMVRGILTVCGVRRCDAGQSDKEDEPLKSAVSDALKRAAVHFGVGRYLYHMPQIWAPYDSQKRRWTEQPRIERAAVDRAIRLAGIAPLKPAPESRGDQRVQQAVRNNERSSSYAHDTGARQDAPPPQEPEELELRPETTDRLKLDDLRHQITQLVGPCKEAGVGVDIVGFAQKWAADRALTVDKAEQILRKLNSELEARKAAA